MTRDSNQPGAHLVFVLGGASSGKSALALRLAGDGLPKAFIATGEGRDHEMAARIEKHRRERGETWETQEIPLDVAGWMRTQGPQFKTVVLDCLTLWLSNLLEAGVTPLQIPSKTDDLLESIKLVSGNVVMVSNELGLGVIPGDSQTRQFRELAGNLNRQIAAAADEVYLSVSGLPLKLK